MARILYGVMGNTYGHVMRSLALAERLSSATPENGGGHEFLFVGGGRVPEALRDRFAVCEVPVLRTVHKAGRVSLPAVLGQIARRMTEIPRVLRQLDREIARFQPDLAIVDREFFLPLAARRAGLRCISLDHSHVLKACRYPVPPSQRVSWTLAMLNDYALFDWTRHNLIVSFFHPPLRPVARRVNELLPPVLRPAVTHIARPAADAPPPADDAPVLVYQTSTTFEPILAPLAELQRPVIVYGFGQRPAWGNVRFKPFDDRGILEDLATCAYAVVNGGHNLLSEAFYFRKPALCFPIATLFEQFINAWHVRTLGYGDFSTERRPGVEIFRRFEARLEEYRARLANAEIDGTAVVVARLREIIAGRGGGGSRTIQRPP
ncbi:MAG: hypothetical protein JO295_07470 [Verrucomicrobia bacterium]|nr:hypothetical protein [Verrucomicrobiota bacterium]